MSASLQDMSGRKQSPKMTPERLEQLARFRRMVEVHLARVGRAIRMRREELDLSRPQLARLIPVADKTVERWENGQSAGASAQLDRVAEVMQTTSAAMLRAVLAEEEKNPTEEVLEAFSRPDRLARVEENVDAILALLQADAKAEEVEQLVDEARAEGRTPSRSRRRKRGAASG